MRQTPILTLLQCLKHPADPLSTATRRGGANQETAMKIRLFAAALTMAVSALFAAGTAVAAPDADAAQALMKKSGCTKCHAIEKSKKGPSYQKVAAKWKGKPEAEAKLIDNITKAPKVKLDDGTEEEHKIVDSKDMKEIKNLIAWILAQ